ncbi:TolC family protein [Adhaeribacter soli]|uniref:TolC family protein n=1 Tax=Adhaeribacter soli TaxID=2607655 RepID=A0A5N1IXN4_9BACT|nr:TolC family protein [Adhaeribacter soli]KAA9332813.1 TolC family protein [Adhaeribacter soli]
MNFKPFVVSCLLVFFAGAVFAQEPETRKLTIDELFALAEQNSPQLQVSKAGMEIADERKALAQTQKRPNVSASAAASYIGDVAILNPNFSELQHVKMPHFGNSFTVQASQVIFKGGAINKTIEKAGLEQETARLSFDKNRGDIKLLLVARYADLYRLAKQEAVYKKHIELAKVRLKNINNMFREGMVTRNDLIRSELQITNLEQALIEIKNNLAITNQQLRVIAGLPSGTTIMPDSNFLQTKRPDQSYEQYLELALSNYPELKASQVNSEIARKNLEISKAERLPTVSLQAGNSLARPIVSASPAMDLYSRGWNAGVSISYNISSLYNSKHSIGVADAQLNQQQQLVTLQRQNLETDVNTAFIKYNEAQQRSASFGKGVQLANENYRIVSKKYLEQLALITDMLDASNAKLDAELQLTNADATIIYTYYQLQRLAGNL